MILALVPAFTSALPVVASDDIVILFTNDAHGQLEPTLNTATPPVQTNMGYATVAAYKKVVEATTTNVALVDIGDHAQGATIAALTRGEAVIKAMNAAGYVLSAVGNHEFDYGMDGLDDLMDWADFDYLSCNFVKLSDNLPVLEAYKILTFGTTKVAFVGVTTPEALTKASPANFQDAGGTRIFGFNEGGNGADLYASVQASVDAAILAGADYVVALGHLGVDTSSEPWTSKNVIANTTGIDAWLDGHSHTAMPGDIVKNKDGDDVVLAQSGTALRNLGQLTIKADGTITSTLIAASELIPQDPAVKTLVDGIVASFAGFLAQKVATSDFDLTVNFPGTTLRAVRMAETNLGSLCADAYRDLFGSDIAFVNGGGVRANIPKGDITYKHIIDVHPFGNTATLIEVTGQTIIDALEMSVSNLPGGYNGTLAFGENGGFLQVSGITFEVWTDIATPVVKDPPNSATGTFVKVDGPRRVMNVMVDGKPIELTKKYTVAGHNFMLLDGGDGFAMFKGATVLDQNVMADYEVLITYIEKMADGKIDAKYAPLAGLGRIVIDRLDVSVIAEAMDDLDWVFDATAAEISDELSVSKDGKDLPDGTLYVKTQAEKDAFGPAVKAAMNAIQAALADRNGLETQAQVQALIAALNAAFAGVRVAEVDIDDLLDAIDYAIEFIISDDFLKISEALQDKWFDAVDAAWDLIEWEETDDELLIPVGPAEGVTQAMVDAAISAIGKLRKTGESTAIFAVAGIALLALVGLAYTARRKFE